MNFRASDIAALTLLLSPERLAALTQLTGSALAAIELHQETLRVGAGLMTLTAGVEIALRNAASENLATHFGVPNWLTQPPVAFAWREPERKKVRAAVDSARRARYAKLTRQEKANLDALADPQGRPPNVPHFKRAQDRRRHLVVTEGKVIAELTLYFWKRLYGPEYEQALWRTTLKRTFPNKKLSRAAVAIQLEQLYQSRNRLAHHEPVLHKRFDDTIRAITFLAEHLEAAWPGPDNPLAKLLADDMAIVVTQAGTLHAKLDAFRVGRP